jgi:hypothetical protein
MRALAVPNRAVVGLLESTGGQLLVARLDFLEADDVGLVSASQSRCEAGGR